MMIQVEIKTVYGQAKVYPACDAAKTFAQLANATTLTAANVRLIKSLGYRVEVVNTNPIQL
jgi:hypothetical protein